MVLRGLLLLRGMYKNITIDILGYPLVIFSDAVGSNFDPSRFMVIKVGTRQIRFDGIDKSNRISAMFGREIRIAKRDISGHDHPTKYARYNRDRRGTCFHPTSNKSKIIEYWGHRRTVIRERNVELDTLTCEHEFKEFFQRREFSNITHWQA